MEQETTREEYQQYQVSQLKGFAVLEQLALIQDELDQLQQIDTVQQVVEQEQ